MIAHGDLAVRGILVFQERAVSSRYAYRLVEILGSREELVAWLLMGSRFDDQAGVAAKLYDQASAAYPRMPTSHLKEVRPTYENIDFPALSDDIEHLLNSMNSQSAAAEQIRQKLNK